MERGAGATARTTNFFRDDLSFRLALRFPADLRYPREIIAWFVHGEWRLSSMSMLSLRRRAETKFESSLVYEIVTGISMVKKDQRFVTVMTSLRRRFAKSTSSSNSMQRRKTSSESDFLRLNSRVIFLVNTLNVS